MSQTAELRSGIYPPLPTFFTSNDELDLRTLRQHIKRIAGSGIAGYVVMGSNGEAVHLSSEERAQVIETTRVEAGEQALVLAGCGEQSTRTSIALCRQAAQAGADFALILPPSYYKGRMDSAALLAHYRAIADSSPLPVVIYNMPDSAAGLDLEAPCTSTDSSGDKIFSVSKRKVGDVIPGGGGTGKSEMQGGTGKYAGITGSCTYKVDMLSANRLVSISKCQWQKP